MTLIQEIDGSIHLGEKYGNSKGTADILSDVTFFFQALKNAEEEVTGLFNNINSMKEVGLASGEEGEGIFDLLCEIYADTEKNNIFNRDKVNIALKNARKSREEIKQKWDTYVLNEVGTQRGIVETLHILVEDTDRYIYLTDLYNEIVASIFPGDKRVISKIKKYKEQSGHLIEGLNLQPSIIQFFEKMSKKKELSLCDITPDIWQWIQDNDFEDRFVIKISVTRTN